MLHRNRCARINVKLLVILILVATALGVSLVAVRQVRRSILSKTTLEAGQAAFEQGDWPAAYRNLQEYLGRNPDDVEILKKYAKARLSIRPLDAGNIGAAIAAYRRIIQLAPLDEVAYDQLAVLYTSIGNFEELAYVARMRLGHVPNDRKASLWLADASIRLNRMEEARQTLTRLIEELAGQPAKPPEYVQACVRMSAIVGAGTAMDAKTKALELLTRAVRDAPESVEALAFRARFYRETLDIPGMDEKRRLALAREDLESADRLGTESPTIRYLLGSEWMAHKELDRAAAELRAAENLAPQTLEERFLDSNDWKVAKYLFAAELAIRRGAATEAASLTDEALTVLTEERHRVRVLPSAIPIYVDVGKVLEARRRLDEYLGLLQGPKGAVGAPLDLARLQALVARAEGRPYVVIDVLQPMLVKDSSHPELWRLLAEAYGRTDQTRLAVNALIQGLRYSPQDPGMTMQLTMQYFRLGDWRKAYEMAGTAESLNPTDINRKLLRIQASMALAIGPGGSPDAGKLAELAAELAPLRQEHPDRADIRALQAAIAASLGQPEKAERELKLAIEECKEPLGAEMQLARHYGRTKRMTEATSVCEAACQRHSAAAEPWLLLSDLHAKDADYAAARHCLRQGLDAVTGKAEKRSLSIKLALLEVTTGDRTTGTRLLRELAAQDAQEIQARTLLLEIRDIQKDPAVAEKLIAELKQAEGQRGLSWRLHQASLWLASDDWRSKQQDIAGLLQFCMDADPQWSAPALLLASMYERLGDFGRVEEICRRAIVRNPSATDIADKLLTLLGKQGRFSEAQNVLAQIQMSPGATTAWQVRMALGAGDVSRAIDELKLRVSNDGRDASARIQLARLLYEQTRDVGQAFRYLTEAEALAPDSMTLTAARVSILKAEGQTEEARRILDDCVASRKDFSAYLMRAAFMANEGQFQRAEDDYRKLTTFADYGATGYQLLSNFHISRKNLDQAVATLEEGLNAHPADPGLERGLTRLLLRRAQGQDRERGIAILGSLEKRWPQDPELMKLRAMLLLERPTAESIGAARALLENVVKLEPTAVEAHLALAGLAMQAGEYQAARDYAIRALASNANHPALLSARARAELALKNAPMAVELAHLVLQEDPNSAEAADVLVEVGQKSNNRNLLGEARTSIDSALGRDPTNEKLLLLRARVLASLERFDTAIPQMETYCQTQQGSSSVAALAALADLYRLAGDADKSKQKIEQAQRIDPNHQIVIHARLLWLVSQNRLEDLEGISSAYLAAKELKPALLLRAASVLAISTSVELKKEGLKLFERAATLLPTSVEARLGLASTLYQTGEAGRAQKIYRELLAEHPDNVQALNDLAWILQEHERRYDAALELANRALKLEPDNPNLLDTRGTILANLADRLAEAKNDFARLVELSPADTREKAKALLRLGRVCAQLNDLPQAKRYLQSALEIDRKIGVFTPDERSEIMKILQQAAP